MVMLWDYDRKTLTKSKRGRLFLLERLINYGIYRKDRDRINLREVKKNWKKLTIDADRRRWLRLLIWGT